MCNLIRGWAGAMVLFVLAGGLCGGCAAGPNKDDPWEKANRFIYNVNDGFDKVALKPVADGYRKVIPQEIRAGLGNGFDNLVYFNVILNDFLQGKWNQGLGDTGRMAANSTVGIGGVFDPATSWGLPSHDNDFGITLAKWGVDTGPYLVLPLLGPSSLRDVSGVGVEYLCSPLTYLDLPLKISSPVYTVDVVDARSRVDRAERFRNAAAIDPYVFTREAYLQYRANRINEGKPTSQPSGLYDEDTGSDATTRPSELPLNQPPPAAK